MRLRFAAVTALLVACASQPSEDRWAGLWVGVATIASTTGGLETSGVTLEIDALADGRYVAVRDGSTFVVLEETGGGELADDAYSIQRDGDALRLTTIAVCGSCLELQLWRSSGALRISGVGPEGDWLVQTQTLYGESALLRDVVVQEDGAASGSLWQGYSMTGGSPPRRRPLRGDWEGPRLSLELGGVSAVAPYLSLELDGDEGAGEGVVSEYQTEALRLAAVRFTTSSR